MIDGMALAHAAGRSSTWLPGDVHRARLFGRYEPTWLNQIKIDFSAIGRQAPSPNDFAYPDAR